MASLLTPRGPLTRSALGDSFTNTTETPVCLFNYVSNIKNHEQERDIIHTTWPELKREGKNQILLFAGAFNPPHQGHLATIRYFAERRQELGIVAMFLFTDPDETVRSKDKKFGEIIIPNELRNLMLSRVPELSQLIADQWLHLIVGGLGDTSNFLGGDKLSCRSAPHRDLNNWSPVDSFLITNARRPVNFYDSGQDLKPHDIPGCTKWERRLPRDNLEEEQERSVGMLWLCKALTIPGWPSIQFRATQSSASTGISSTRIRKIMWEAPDEELYDGLKDQVVSAELLVEWLQASRERKRVEDETVL
ncbi:hypothetical protein B0J14DRAFT_629900 [Halenospora varia]|nr:hypothetical protein B0J14DRAFT_629900 [Halenospora varia]